MAVHVHLVRRMSGNILVVMGRAGFDSGAVKTVAGQFGWTVEIAEDLREAAAAQAYRRTIAVLFHRGALGACSWVEALRLVRLGFPETHPIVCHGFSEPIDWPGLCDAGAFHDLWLPLKEEEVRQSFGFLWEAEKRRLVPARGSHAQVMASAVG